MVETPTLLTFVSILFLIAVELSGRAANTDLSRFANTTENDYLGVVPNLGFLTIVHLFNVFILMMGHIMVSIEFLSGDDLFVTLLYLATFVLLIILPYIEIEEYDLLKAESRRKRSWNAHFLMSAVIFGEPYILIFLGMIPFDSIPITLGVLVLFLPYLLGTVIFLHMLRNEIRTKNVQMVLDDY